MKRRCQCDPDCKRSPIDGEPFCKQHSKKCNRIAPLSGSELTFHPDFYNKNKRLLNYVNCYGYAVGHTNPDKKLTQQPGYASGYSRFGEVKQASSEHTCADITARMFGDMPSIVGPVSFTDKCPPKTSKIALVVDPSADYHYYRQDSNGWWSHKPGSTSVTNMDAAGINIWDPLLASRTYPDNNQPLDYSAACGYMCVHRDIKPRVSGGKKIRKSRRNRTRKIRSKK